MANEDLMRLLKIISTQDKATAEKEANKLGISLSGGNLKTTGTVKNLKKKGGTVKPKKMMMGGKAMLKKKMMGGGKALTKKKMMYGGMAKKKK